MSCQSLLFEDSLNKSFLNLLDTAHRIRLEKNSMATGCDLFDIAYVKMMTLFVK